ncbi:alcohol dehydrogenase catalytic domain-containing protein [Actinophytocola glycyrrhizae]|uniref:Alcohol dehydrogenase catalytic domain-containing protein n=1 Tax=Actinophytocola glycyrrhizae TaxID=2044873 RepID=A0ABV9S5E8_9PSEU
MTDTYRAAVVRAAHGPVDIEAIPAREPIGDEVAIEVTACGLCHSDVHFMHGTSGTDFPYVVGHEVAGRVSAVGKDATGVKVGDTVVVAPMVPCGQCGQCTGGRPAACAARLLRRPPIPLADGVPGTPVLGVGGLAERVLVPARNVVPIDPRVPPQIAALLGCGVPSGYGAAVNTAEVGPADDVAVIGCGAVGVAAIAGAAAAGAARIVAVDVNAGKLDVARKFGATDLVDASTPDAVGTVRRLTGGRGADVVLDAVGGPATFGVANGMRATGSRLVVVGAPKVGDSFALPLRDLFLTGGSIRVSIWGDCVAARDLPMLAARYLDGSLPLDEYLTGTFALADAEHGYEQLLAGQVLRSVVMP